jgi:fatty acid synthase subunit alpha
LISAYGFSIVEIVRENPKKKALHFGGIKGQAIRERYMEMTMWPMTRRIRTVTSRVSLFSQISAPTRFNTTSRIRKVSFFATQFALIALVVTSRAAFEDMRSKGLVQPDAAFAGHLLGGFSALVAVANILPDSSLVDIVFIAAISQSDHAA